jgi:hypothetical protein
LVLPTQKKHSFRSHPDIGSDGKEKKTLAKWGDTIRIHKFLGAPSTSVEFALIGILLPD